MTQPDHIFQNVRLSVSPKTMFSEFCLNFDPATHLVLNTTDPEHSRKRLRHPHARPRRLRQGEGGRGGVRVPPRLREGRVIEPAPPPPGSRWSPPPTAPHRAGRTIPAHFGSERSGRTPVQTFGAFGFVGPRDTASAWLLEMVVEWFRTPLAYQAPYPSILINRQSNVIQGKSSP